MLVYQSLTAEFLSTMIDLGDSEQRAKIWDYLPLFVALLAVSAVYWQDVLREISAFFTHLMTGEPL
jgi:hypothetical protein